MRVLIFGATGTIGTQTIEVIKANNWTLCGISFHTNSQRAKKINAKYKFSVIDKKLSNVKNYEELIIKSKPDIIVNAIVGFAGLIPTYLSLKHKKTLCLANKESLVVAGKFVTELAKKHKVKIYPIDSEHAALIQILKQNPHRKFKKLYITASGGPFYNWPLNKLKHVTYQQTIKHPTWNMGGKISIDSATMFNKAFEIVEAYWYFHTTNIEALYHPQSHIHAIVDYGNEKVMFENTPDMKLHIWQALTEFKNPLPNVKPLNTSKYKLEPLAKVYTSNDIRSLPMVWAYQFVKSKRFTNHLMVLWETSNEIAIQLYKDKVISFLDIYTCVKVFISKFIKQDKLKLPKIRSINDIVKFHDYYVKWVKKYIFK